MESSASVRSPLVLVSMVIGSSQLSGIGIDHDVIEVVNEPPELALIAPGTASVLPY